MSNLAVAFLFCLFTFTTGMLSAMIKPVVWSSLHAPVEIDSLDTVIFDIDQALTNGDYVDIPVIISTDDLIFTLDFSMKIDTANLEFVSVIDHTGELDYTAYLNPNDLKLRFTSNSFSPFPTFPQNVVSIRFKVESGVIFNSDMESPLAYLNGESCTAQCSGEQYILGNKEIISHEDFISPNPAYNLLFINNPEEGKLELFDMQGNKVIRSVGIHSGMTNNICTGNLPRGMYLAIMHTSDHKIKTQRIILQ